MNDAEFWAIIDHARSRFLFVARSIFRQRFAEQGRLPDSADELESLVNLSLQRDIHPLTDLIAQFITEELLRYSPDEITAYDALFVAYLDQSFTAEMYCAYALMDYPLLEGYVSADGFIYFRAWLIAQGKTVYEKVLADVEYLTEYLFYADPPEGESLLYAAKHAHQKITDADELIGAGGYNNDGVRGVKVPDTTNLDWLRQQFPRLYQHCIKQPTN